MFQLLFISDIVEPLETLTHHIFNRNKIVCIFLALIYTFIYLYFNNGQLLIVKIILYTLSHS